MFFIKYFNFQEELQFTQDLLKIIANRAHKDDTDTEVNR